MDKTALLVIDFQNGLVADKPYSLEETVANIKELIKSSRKNGVEVIYIQHDGGKNDILEPNSEGWEIYREIAPNSDEKVISKKYNSAFRETKLKEYLDSREIKQLIITGMQTEYCIDTSCKVAFEYGYKLIIPEKTNTTFDNGNIKAKDLYEFYNFNIFKNRFGIVEDVEKTIKRITEK